MDGCDANKALLYICMNIYICLYLYVSISKSQLRVVLLLLLFVATQNIRFGVVLVCECVLCSVFE